MLVLSRKSNESIHVGDDIRIVVLDIRGDKVRLGIEAPRAVPVHRSEVYHAIRRGQQQASGSTGQLQREAAQAFEKPHEAESVV